MKPREILTLLGVATVAYIGTSMYFKSRNEKKSGFSGRSEAYKASSNNAMPKYSMASGDCGCGM